MAENSLYSQSGAARELGVSRDTISDLVKILGIVPKRMSNGKARGLDPADMRALRKVLTRRDNKSALAAP